MWKNRFLYFVLLVYGTILAILYSGYSTWLAAVVLWLLPLVLFFFLLAGRRQIKIEPMAVKELAQRGEVLEAGFLAENRSFLPGFPGRLKVEARLPYQKKRCLVKRSFVLKGRSRNQIEVPIAAEHCGRLEIIYRGFWIYDYFGLCFFPKKEARGRFLVRALPELVEIVGDYTPAGLASEEEEERFSEYQPGDSPGEIFGFHEYRPGDRISAIHWKLSSKREEWIVKEYSLPVMVATGIWFDFGRELSGEAALKEWDLALSALLSLSAALLERGYSHFIYFGEKRLLIEAEEEIVLALDEIYQRQLWLEMRPPENPAPDLFYIGSGGADRELWAAGIMEGRGFFRPVNTKNIRGILENV